MASNRVKIDELQQRIAKERKIIHGFQVMRTATGNQDIIRSCDSKIRDSEKTISFYEQSIRELHESVDQGTSTSAPSTREAPVDPRPTHSAHSSHSTSYSDQPSSHSTLVPSSPGSKNSTGAKTYSPLDLIKYDTPLTAAKIGRMLHHLEFKIAVENQYKNGIEKMLKLYQQEGDKKSRSEAERKRIESNQKMMLLTQALKRYKNLEVTGIKDDDAESEERKGHPRRPLSGALQITIASAKDLDHAPLTSKKGITESIVVVKVEDTPRARTHPVRNDRWNEAFEIHVDKANELEVIIYDRASSAQDSVIPIGVLWIRLSDVVEELRRKKFGLESGPGWVTAARVKETGSGGGELMNLPPGAAPAGFAPPEPSISSDQAAGTSSDGVDAWFAVEPAGALRLQLNFVKSNVRKRPYDTGGLGRQGAVRKRKEEVHVQNGHQFVAQQFYQIVRCALCGELLYNASGMQCEDCKYLCHKRCFTKVVTKCISKSNVDTDGDEEKMLNYRIPHRFEPMTTITPSWCCHCGMMLPLGRRQLARRCTECPITAHADCTHLVPDFCGMSMEKANRLLQEIKTAKSRQSTRMSSHSPLKPSPEPPQSLHQDMGRLQLSNTSPPSPPAGPSSDYQQSHSPGSRTSLSSHPPGSFNDPSRHDRLSITGPPMPRPLPAQPSMPPSQSGAGPPFPPFPQPGGNEGPIPYPPQPRPLPSQPSQTRPEFPNPLALVPSHSSGPPSSAPQVTSPVKSKGSRKIGLDDFNFLAVLGKGNFGKVMLAEEKRSGQLWAIKVLKKDFIIENDEVESTKSEKRVFLTASRERHPFLIGLHSCFQTETRIYFVMEYVSGGDLMLHIQREQFTPRRAKFYAAEVLLALEYFHQNGVIYRDLKLDNILLTLDGHIKVADYGLCKEEMWYQNTTSTFCGTPEFMAPEILLEQRYGRAVDWWAFGVLIYEMLLGQSPFRGDDEDEIFDAILEDEPLYPIHMPRDSVSILQKLLTRDPTRRLGGGPNDAEEIKAHPFFRETNWADVYGKKIPAPYFPTINGPMDVSNFDSEFTKESPRLTPVHSQLRPEDQKEFEGFSWTAPWAQ
ncbi:Serine/threonine kinase [Puccinia graminis f. sp. tritici]|uniref:protein kinase C n=1 Tax=Puccinia graminis f. sp. tritici TaxID=56615 RepID=A0A5B0PM98_PUCGR|nr:Serine/threonine kinase [Puccinia graminis f. sp. tritici]